MKKSLLGILFVVTVLFCLAGCSSAVDEAKEAVNTYNTEIEEYNKKITPYNEAVDAIIAQNDSLEQATNDAQEVINKGEQPFDEETLNSLKSAMAEVINLKAAVPEKLPVYKKLSVDEDAKKDDLKALKEQAEKDVASMKEVEVPAIPEIPDFTQNIEEINTLKAAYEDSIQSLKQITAPSDDFVMERLKTVKTITEIDHVTEDNDPNGQLNKQGGYIGCIYFRDKKVDRSELYLGDGSDVITVGTDGGGAIEIYNTQDEANVRDTYLASFDGTGLSSGSHYVYGTIIIRTSTYLNGTQQKELTQKILEALTKIEK